MIVLVHDGEPDTEVAEKCCFCQRRTRMWCAAKDVAVCTQCAEHKTLDDVPSKRDWINSQRAPGEELLPEGWMCHVDRQALAPQSV